MINIQDGPGERIQSKSWTTSQALNLTELGRVREYVYIFYSIDQDPARLRSDTPPPPPPPPRGALVRIVLWAARLSPLRSIEQITATRC